VVNDNGVNSILALARQEEYDTIQFPSNYRAIGSSAFGDGFVGNKLFNSDVLLHVVFDSPTVQIGEFGFSCCRKLVDVKAKEITSIDYGAFMTCSSFTGFIASSGTTIPTKNISPAQFTFMACPLTCNGLNALEEVEFGNWEKENFTTKGVIIRTKGDDSKIITAAGEIAENVTESIDGFSGLGGVTKVNIRLMAEKEEGKEFPIESNCFYGCYSLQEVVFSKNNGKETINRIGNNAFAGCSSLTKIT
jgi:hypothetical protein